MRRTFVTVEEFSRRHAMSEAAVRRRIRAGELPAMRLGGRWMLPADALAQAYAMQTAGGAYGR